MPTRFSIRVSDHRVGRPSCFAIQQVTTASGSMPNLAPNPPPTSGVMIRTTSAVTPSAPTSAPLVPWAPWLGIQAVSRPSSPHTAAADAGLHRRRRHPPVLDDLAGHHLAAVEQVGVGRGRVAERADHVRPGRGEQQPLVAGQRVVHVDHRGQEVVVDVDQLDRVLALVHLLGDDRGDRLPDEPDGVTGQQ